MCIICVELIKQRMTIIEAKRNSLELLEVELKNADSYEDKKLKHAAKLRTALSSFDLEKLGEVLDEGIKDDAS